MSRVRAPAHPVAALEHECIVSETLQFAGGGEPGKTGAHYYDVRRPGRIGHIS